jgi:hypothetical protein
MPPRITLHLDGNLVRTDNCWRIGSVNNQDFSDNVGLDRLAAIYIFISRIIGVSTRAG